MMISIPKPIVGVLCNDNQNIIVLLITKGINKIIFTEQFCFSHSHIPILNCKILNSDKKLSCRLL